MYHPRLKGNYYDMGNKYGSILFKNGFVLPELNDEKMEFGLKSLNVLKNFYPEIIEEIKGFSDAGKVSYEKTACFILSIGAFDISAGCSIFAVNNGKQVFIGRNYDLSIDAKKFTESSLICPKNNYAYLGHSDCFLGKVDGVNEKGLSAAIAFVSAKKIKTGLNFYFVNRYILEKCKSVQEACDVLKNINFSIGVNYLLADKNGDMAVVETSSEKIRIRKNDSKFIACTNHFNHPDMIDQEKIEDRVWSKTEIRYSSLIDNLQQTEKADMKKCKKILSDSKNHVCLYLKKYNFGTLFSHVTNLNSLEMERAEGIPNRAKYLKDNRLSDCLVKL